MPVKTSNSFVKIVVKTSRTPNIRTEEKCPSVADDTVFESSFALIIPTGIGNIFKHHEARQTSLN